MIAKIAKFPEMACMFHYLCTFARKYTLIPYETLERTKENPCLLHPLPCGNGGLQSAGIRLWETRLERFLDHDGKHGSGCHSRRAVSSHRFAHTEKERRRQAIVLEFYSHKCHKSDTHQSCDNERDANALKALGNLGIA